MLDFTPVRNKEITFGELAEDLTREDLRRLTNEMIDVQLALIELCTDAHVVFVPEDADAHDPAAESVEEIEMPWTLGHVIVHTTASAEESAFLAAELARGVDFQPRRSRAEVPWETVTTIAQCRRRLEESRRMRLASLDMWPDDPHLDNHYESSRSGMKINAIIRFVFGLSHDDSHLEHIEKIVAQAKRLTPSD